MKNSREKTIIKVSIIGILANIMLVIFKAAIGIISNSIAIIMDALNNLSDVMSSVITIIGTKLSGKAPDKEHPYGHGRIEYITAMVIAIIVLYAGITAIWESVKKIINPETPNYSIVSVIIVLVAVVVKIVLGIYVKRAGKKVKSDSLINSGQDALMDSIISSATVVAAVIFIVFGISIEPYLAAIISLIIIRAGYQMLRGTLSQILGERVDSAFSKEIKSTVIKSDPNIKGAYDLILTDYGPDRYLGSIHIEVPSTLTAIEIDRITRKIMKDVYKKHNVIMAAVGIYSLNIEDKEALEIRQNVMKIVHSYKNILQMHGFYFDSENKTINFDVIIDFEEKDRDKIYKYVYKKMKELYPDYKINITLDMDISD